MKKIQKLDYKFPEFFSPELIDFLQKILIIDPERRMTEDEALNHPWILKYKKCWSDISFKLFIMNNLFPDNWQN